METYNITKAYEEVEEPDSTVAYTEIVEIPFTPDGGCASVKLR